MIQCRACGSPATERFTRDQVATFYRCPACRSVTSDQSYSTIGSRYDDRYMRWNLDDLGGFDHLRAQCTTNVELVVERQVPEQSLLDVGCCDGALLDRFAELGWDVYGFDVIASVPPFVHGLTAGRVPQSRIKIAPEFSAQVVCGRRFGAVVLREVVEHVDDPERLISSAAACVLPGGLLQVQTPDAHDDPTDRRFAYQDAHLVLLAPAVLDRWFRELGFTVEDHRTWPCGQLILGRR